MDIGAILLVHQRMSDIERSRRRLRLFLANRAIALAWALKGSCKPCAHWLFTTARWLVPEAQRFLVDRIFECTADLSSGLSPLKLFVGVVLLVVLGFVGLLDLAMQTTAIATQPAVEASALGDEPQISSESAIFSVSKSPEPMQGFVSETGSLPRAQIAPVPLPMRKPEGAYKVPNGKESVATQKRMAQQKNARSKSMR